MRYPTMLLIPIAIVGAALILGNENSNDSLHAEAPRSEPISNEAASPALYQQWCSSCHGPDGRDFRDRSWKLGSRSEDFERIIRDGYPLLGMPAYGNALSPEDISSLVEFVLLKASEEPEFVPAPPTVVQASDLKIRSNLVVEGLETPWGMDFINDSTLLITEREGRLWCLSEGIMRPVVGLPDDIHVKGQGGLLDVMYWDDPRSDESWIYLTYSKANPDHSNESATALVRSPWSQSFIAQDDSIELTGWEELFVATPFEKTHRHYGSRVVMGMDGCLYLTCGERGMRDTHPQTLATRPGKVHRLLPNGAIPPDNPFLNDPEAQPSIWTWGHRNPQGMFVDPENGAIWTHEHGPKGGDEINILSKGHNYGWPMITFGRNYSGTIITRDTAMAGMDQPLYYWLPSIGACGMDMVHGGNWPETWQRNLLVGSLSFEYLERLALDEQGRVYFRENLLEGVGRVRDIARNSKGEIFVAIEGAGIIYHLEPWME